MTNNDILRSLRNTFDYDDTKMISIFAAAEQEVNREQVCNWLKKEDDPQFKALEDVDLAAYLNGLINTNRGKKEGEQQPPEQELTNNLIFKKLKIAMNLKSEDVLSLLNLAGLEISNQELSAFFRSPGHKNYRECKDQVLRNFLNGLNLKSKVTN